MRRINVKNVKAAVKDLCIKSNLVLPISTVKALEAAFQKERSKQGKKVLKILLSNAKIASREKLPICQDTGFAVLFVEVGQDVIFTGGDIKKAINQGVGEGYKKGYLRKSIVKGPLKRQNTKDNTPSIVHFDIVKGDKVKITLLPKGGGGENVSVLKMLKPADGIEGIKTFVLDTVRQAGAKACPPMVIGIGIGGTFDFCPLLAKKALLRPLGKKNKDALYEKLEKDLLNAINKTGIGPSGFGGIMTALAVHIEHYPCHIASLPCAVNIQCNAHRYKSCLL